MNEDQFDDFVRAHEADENFPLRRYVEAPTYFDALGDVSGKAVLDVGCGDGLHTRRLKARGASRVVGLDIAAHMIAYARAREATELLEIDYVCDDAANASRHGSFDVVTAIYLTPFIETKDAFHAVCRGAADALRPGGRFLPFTLNPGMNRERRDYYHKYGFDFFPVDDAHLGDGPIPDGAPLRFVCDFAGIHLEATAHYWSREAQEDALRAAGFSNITWIPPWPSAEGIERFGAEFWQDYLHAPHMLPVMCVK